MAMEPDFVIAEDARQVHVDYWPSRQRRALGKLLRAIGEIGDEFLLVTRPAWRPGTKPSRTFRAVAWVNPRAVKP